MDGQKFDALVRSVGQTRSRRGVLGIVAGGALAALGVRQAAAQDVGTELCVGPRQRCERPRECCGGGRVGCERISRDCDKKSLRRRDRCCGQSKARCADSCDCCRGLVCGRDNRCTEEDAAEDEDNGGN